MNAKKAAAMISIKADSKALERDLADAKKRLRAFGKDVKNAGTKVGGKMWGGGKGAIASIGGGIGTAAVFGIEQQIQATKAFETNLVRMQIAAGKSTVEMDSMREAIQGVSRATGISTDDILAGTQSYVDLTGDVEGANAAMSQFARIAQASGASVSDVATATAALKESMKLDPGDIETAFSGLIMQGKAGAVSLKDFAGELSKLAPQFAKFGGSGIEGIADLGASFQIVRKGFGSASEAATGMQSVMSALSRNSRKFGAAGVKIFKIGKNGKQSFRGWLDIIDQIDNSKLANDQTKLTEAFGSVEAERAFNMLRSNRQELEKIYTAGLDAGAVQRDLTTYLESNAGKLDVAMNNLKLSIVETFTPERITAFVEAVEAVADAIGTVIFGLGEIKDNLSGKSEAVANPYAVGNKDLVGPSAKYRGGGLTAWYAQDSDEDIMRGMAERRHVDATLYGPDSEAGQLEANRKAFDLTSKEIAATKGREAQIRKAVEIQMAEYGDNIAGSRGRHDAANAVLGDIGQDKVSAIRQDIHGTRTAQGMVDLVGAFQDALKNAKFNVFLDGSEVSRKVDNAAVHRGGAKR